MWSVVISLNMLIGSPYIKREQVEEVLHSFIFGKLKVRQSKHGFDLGMCHNCLLQMIPLLGIGKTLLTLDSLQTIVHPPRVRPEAFPTTHPRS